MIAKHFIMIGAPVTKVRTPLLLKALLADSGVKADIETCHVEPGDLDTFVRGAEADRSIDGLLVTMPHKKTIIPYLETASDTAMHVGSVNAVKRISSGKLVGAQFDGIALVNALLAKGVPVSTASVLLVGIGGAGMAIAHAISAHGCKELAITDKDTSLVDAAIETLHSGVVGRANAPLGIDQTRYDLLINATPLGMKGSDPSPFPDDLVARTPWVADIVADPPQTRLAAMARKAQVTLITGRDMVQGQVEPIGRWLISDAVEQ